MLIRSFAARLIVFSVLLVAAVYAGSMSQTGRWRFLCRRANWLSSEGASDFCFSARARARVSAAPVSGRYEPFDRLFRCQMCLQFRA